MPPAGGSAGSEDAAVLWAPWWRDPHSGGLFTDFDGTISAIVDEPADAVPLQGMRDVLSAIAGSLRCVAVVSGRPVAFLEKHLGRVPNLHLVGIYGMETLRDGRRQVDAEAAKWAPVVDAVAARAEVELGSGVELEHKGLSLVLHARRRPEVMGPALAWASDAAARTGLSAKPGRMSVELLPPVGADKGSVVSRLSEGLAAVAFLGDDSGDVSAFDSLEPLRSGGVATLRVVAASQESPPALLERADVVVDGPPGVLGLLQQLAAGLH
ncbi:MAG TPA: trehalose-phosphatase [Acidimicrobiales bacterium]|nr:trehalose-phosphatase [Acidimicrobiales bacterium]